MQIKDITLAILVKDKSKELPLFLECISNQSYPKEYINLYIRSNNNSDNSIEILDNWILKNQKFYKSVYKDYSPANIDITKYKNHEWNSKRFLVLGKIREESIKYAMIKKSNYFVVDVDNFICSKILENLYNSNLPIIGPYLKEHNSYYSNYHNIVDNNGYFKNNEDYYKIYDQSIKGLINVDVIHCTYYIQYQFLEKMKYLDETNRHEYVIFSENCRKQNIQQYLDNRKIYGYISFDENPDLNYYRELLSKIERS